MKSIDAPQQDEQNEDINIQSDVFVGKPLLVSSIVSYGYEDGCPFDCGNDCGDSGDINWNNEKFSVKLAEKGW